MTNKKWLQIYDASVLYLRRVGTAFLAVCFVATYATAGPPHVDGSNPFSPRQHGDGDNPYPPPDDPSQFTGPTIGDLPDDLPDTNLGAFEGGVTGTSGDAADNS